MTIAAIGRGRERNLLVVDWVKGALQPNGTYDFETVRCDKVLRVGDAHLTVVGDDQARVAAYTLGMWAGGRCPDFTQDEAFNALVELTSRFWRVLRMTVPRAERRGFTLVLCAADVAYHRRVQVENYEVVRVDDGCHVGEGLLDVIYGGKPFHGGYDETKEGLVERAVDAMRRVDVGVRQDENGRGCKALPYLFPSTWSTVVIPVDGAAPERESPFSSPTQEVAWEAGLADLAIDVEFCAFPKPADLPLRP
jgi:hypothetical protein